jgi:Plasmid pRiA4b ORF-3-like protein
MGRTDSHLHVFRSFDFLADVVVEIGIPVDGYPSRRRTLHDREVPIGAYLTEFYPVLIYEYDFGDSWIHSVCLEFIRPEDPDQSYPLCVAGERACPPENCGGAHMYPELLETLADPKHPEHSRLREWAGPYFDPEVFDPTEIRFEDPEKRWEQTLGARQ